MQALFYLHLMLIHGIHKGQNPNLLHLFFTATGLSISPQHKPFLMKHTAGMDQQISPLWEHDAHLCIKKRGAKSPITFTLFLGHRMQTDCIIWEVFQTHSLFLFKFMTHSMKQNSLSYCDTLFRRGAVNVDEYRTDQVPHKFFFFSRPGSTKVLLSLDWRSPSVNPFEAWQ